MHKRVSPTEAIHAGIDAVFAEGRPLADCLEQVARLSAKLIIQTALEAEADEFLGRARYQRADAAPAQDDGGKGVAADDLAVGSTVRAGHRNGHREVTIKTTLGGLFTRALSEDGVHPGPNPTHRRAQGPGPMDQLGPTLPHRRLRRPPRARAFSVGGRDEVECVVGV
ncbi:hypothetical protein [Streptomyces noursei]|uniref:hypothetical protein n=1 Tax=Streptomyces noursei TaxID=1971 RepID=UPI0015E1381F|nr:hypothetical protein [Streptomyces noursei]